MREKAVLTCMAGISSKNKFDFKRTSKDAFKIDNLVTAK